MTCRYGELPPNQVAEAKTWMRKQIFFLLLYVDPKTKERYKEINIDEAFTSFLTEVCGLNSLFNYPLEIVKILSLLEAARLEIGENDYDEVTWNNCKYRKLILDAGNEVLKIKEV